MTDITTTPTVDSDKMRELVLYVAGRLGADPANGSIKRNKVLAFADFGHFHRYGTSITGAEYVKHTFGPAPRGIKELERRLEDDGDATTVVIGGAYPQRVLFPKRAVDLTLFTGTEIAAVDEALSLLEGKTGRQSSDLSHEQMLGWKYAAEKDVIPYHTVFLYEGPVTASDREAGRAALAKLQVAA